jgi:hypothetical protein
MEDREVQEALCRGIEALLEAGKAAAGKADRAYDLALDRAWRALHDARRATFPSQPEGGLARSEVMVSGFNRGARHGGDLPGWRWAEGALASHCAVRGLTLSQAINELERFEDLVLVPGPAPDDAGGKVDLRPQDGPGSPPRAPQSSSSQPAALPASLLVMGGGGFGRRG